MKKILLLLAAVAGIFTGCVPPELTLRHFPENPSAPLTVAALLPLTGENRIYAEQMLEGLLAAESRINRSPSISDQVPHPQPNPAGDVFSSYPEQRILSRQFSQVPFTPVVSS